MADDNAGAQARTSSSSTPKSQGAASPGPIAAQGPQADAGDGSEFVPLKTAGTEAGLKRQCTIQDEDQLFRNLSRRRTCGTAPAAEQDEESREVERLMSRLFGRARRAQGEKEEAQHSGVVFRGLTVKGVGLGAQLQPTVGDMFAGLPRLVRGLARGGLRAATAQPAVRELISQFDGCVRPSELLLVLGRPGAGCTTFLKAFCNQRGGFAGVDGQVTYGGTAADDMARLFRGDVIYNPEDDLHYATMTVRRTLRFALQTRTPGKEARLGDESRGDYVRVPARHQQALLDRAHARHQGR